MVLSNVDDDILVQHQVGVQVLVLVNVHGNARRFRPGQDAADAFGQRQRRRQRAGAGTEAPETSEEAHEIFDSDAIFLLSSGIRGG